MVSLTNHPRPRENFPIGPGPAIIRHDPSETWGLLGHHTMFNLKGTFHSC